MNIKTIILLIGIFTVILGIKNMYNTSNTIYKFLPRNVYDEIFLSLPLAQFDNKLYNTMNPEYALEDEDKGNYNNLSKVI